MTISFYWILLAPAGFIGGVICSIIVGGRFIERAQERERVALQNYADLLDQYIERFGEKQ